MYIWKAQPKHMSECEMVHYICGARQNNLARDALDDKLLISGRCGEVQTRGLLLYIEATSHEVVVATWI